MHVVPILQALALLVLANGAPVIAKRVLGGWFDWPVDARITFFDHRPLFGRSKTWRGILAAVLATGCGAPVIGVAPQTGAVFALAAMIGDLFSSFIKRRLGMLPSSRALGLDQVPESLLPLIVYRQSLSLTALLDIAFAVIIFVVGEIGLSRLLYMVHVRDEPY